VFLGGEQQEVHRFGLVEAALELQDPGEIAKALLEPYVALGQILGDLEGGPEFLLRTVVITLGKGPFAGRRSRTPRGFGRDGSGEEYRESKEQEGRTHRETPGPVARAQGIRGAPGCQPRPRPAA